MQHSVGLPDFACSCAICRLCEKVPDVLLLDRAALIEVESALSNLDDIAQLGQKPIQVPVSHHGASLIQR
jgi:hypothetical protein